MVIYYIYSQNKSALFVLYYKLRLPPLISNIETLPRSVDWISALYWLPNTYVCTTIELYIHSSCTFQYVLPEVHLSYLYIHVYVMRLNSKGATLLLYNGDKVAKRGSIEEVLYLSNLVSSKTKRGVFSIKGWKILLFSCKASTQL